MDEPRQGELPLTDMPPSHVSEYNLSPHPPRPPDLHDRIHSLFVGPDGLRVPWRLIAYLLMAFAILAVLSIFLHFWRASGVARIWLGMVSEAQLTIAVIIPAYLLSRIERRPFGDYGLPPKQAFGKLFWIGALWGLAWLTVLMLILRGTGAFYFGGIALHGVRVLKFAAFYALFFLLVGFFEEFMMRGYTQFTLTQGIGFWPAAVILSTAFGGIHLGNKGEAWIGVLAAGLIGFFFCLTLRRTGNLWFAIGFHASWDWGETYLYSVPNSGMKSPGHLLSSSLQGSTWLTGGSIGPEGSIFLFVVLAIMWVVFDRLYPVAKYPPVRSPDVSAELNVDTLRITP
jgi:membrane protease YdiL (CAAX protease family)